MSGRDNRPTRDRASHHRRGSEIVATQSTASRRQQAIAFHQKGVLDEAERIYDDLLRELPRDAQLLHLKGVLRQQRGDHSGSVTYLTQARDLATSNAVTRFALAQSLWQLGDTSDAIRELEEAQRCDPGQPAYALVAAQYLSSLHQDQQAAQTLEAAEARHPDHPDLCQQLGNTYWKLDALPRAVDVYQRVLRKRPDCPEVLASLGSVLISLNRLDEAAQALRRATSLRPDFATAHNNLGNALRQLGDLETAISHFSTAIALTPSVAVYHDNRGLAFRDGGRSDEAIADFRRAIELDPAQSTAHLHLGTALRDRRLNSEALPVLERACELAPSDATAIESLACCLFDLRRFRDSRARHEQALTLDPHCLAAWENLAICAGEQGDLETVVRACDEAFRLSPDHRHRVRKAMRMPPIFDSAQAMQQRRLELRHDLDQLRAEGCRLQNAAREIHSANFYIAYHGENERDLLSLIADFYQQADPSLAYVAAHCRSTNSGMASKPRTRRRIRVGFLSRFFCNHSVGLHYGGLIREMSHEDFEIFVLRMNQPDDDVATAIAGAADATINLVNDFEKARQQIADCELDILIYTDLGMDHFTYFLAFARLAPVQCVLAGHPITSGVPAIDYFISNDAMEPCNADDHYREQLIRLRGLMTRLARPQSPRIAGIREACGIREPTHLYLCPQTLFKLHPDFDAIVGEILRRDPLGVLLLFHAESMDWSELLQKRMQRTIPDVASRIAWRRRMPMPDFLALTAQADVMLDTPHFNGGTTSMLALALGTPIVTMPGPYMRGRTTLFCYRQMGVADLVAKTPADYVRIANDVAMHRDQRDSLRRQLIAASSCLFECESVVPEFEDCLRELFARRRAG